MDGWIVGYIDLYSQIGSYIAAAFIKYKISTVVKKVTNNLLSISALFCIDSRYKCPQCYLSRS